ncbi:MAG: DUF4412 domain-containing protein [Syntrophaceae bacterium]|nr:DUF4412 domain-containing protein [Syntrophaceae bacterium]
MKKRLFVLAAMMIALIFAGTALAMEFSADMVNKGKGGKGMTSKVYMKDKKFRWESKQQDTITISRQDLMKTWIVMPKQKTYMEMTFDPSKAQEPQEKMKGEISRKLVGSDTVDGHPTKKYEITYKDGQRQMKSYQWLATDLNQFPVKSAAVDGSWSMEYRNIRMGSQPDSLFEPPAGFKKMAMPGMPARPRR